jgi:uncharacterized protein
MNSRIQYTISMAWKYKAVLRKYRQDKALQIKSLLELDPRQLKAQGIEALILDFDGVLASHGESEPNSEVSHWLHACLKIFGDGKIFILTNEPTLSRENHFKDKLSGIKWLTPERKKPFPDGALAVINQSGIQPETLLLVDDRLLTGILMAAIVGIPGLYVTHPWISLSSRPFIETFYILLRRIERLLF